MFVCANNRRLVDECGWSPSFSLTEGLTATFDWWRVHGRRGPAENGLA
jgi:nucleoside-diphosphate-sugar epimerase